MKRSIARYYRQKNAEEFKQKGKDKFDFTDMHFDLGPMNKIFGPGGVRIKTQGSAELKLARTHALQTIQVSQNATVRFLVLTSTRK